MRPPLNAGENAVELPVRATYRFASMRPPLNAGENIAPHVARVEAELLQ